MGMERVFLGWDRPPLQLAGDWFAAEGDRRGGDLSDLRVFVPTSAAQRYLESGLARMAKRRRWAYCPPMVMTVGQLPEQLYTPKKPFAQPLLEELLWADVLRSATAEVRSPVIGNAPAATDSRAWRDLGELLLRLRKELAGDQLDCRRVRELAQQLDGFSEQARWAALAQLEAEYLRRLDELGLWDRQAARLEAIRLGECRTDHNIVLVGLVDLNRTMRAMLDAVAARVTALVFAPSSAADCFDEHGCLIPDRWASERLPLDHVELRVAEEAAGAATAVLDVFEQLGSDEDGVIELPFAADQVAIAVADDSTVPHLRRGLASRGLKLRYGPGESLAQSSPVRLWLAIADWLSSFRYAAFATLVRHPDVWEYLRRRAELADDFFQRLEEYHAAFLPSELRPFWVGRGSTSECESARIVARAVQVLDEWLGTDTLSPRSLSAWAPVLRQAMIELLHNRTLDADRYEDQHWLSALSYLDEVLSSWEVLPRGLAEAYTASDAWLELTDGVARVRVPESRDVEAIEAEGWLDAPWMDTDVVLVVGMNEGVIPQAVNADPFLPNRLRATLGLDDNARRYARDCYATRLLIESRSHVALIAMRQNAEGDPLLPSRLWFQQEPEQQFEAIDRFVNDDALLARRSSWLMGQAAPVTDPPEPVPLTEEQRSRLYALRVTQFRDYLRCPYRFYLRHVLGLEKAGGEPTELDALAFGTLMHDVLHGWAASELRDSTDPAAIAAFLTSRLDDEVQARYGHRPLVAIRLQQELMRQRLTAFSERQAELRREGWEVVASECDGTPYLVETSHGTVEIVGRIDRIDWHAGSGILRVLDYKTGNQGTAPERTHRKAGEWIDLQLPLYRHIVPESVKSQYSANAIQLGYFVLPRKVVDTKVLLADWDEQELREADSVALDVIEHILNEDFYPPNPTVGADEYAEICLDGMLTG